MTIMDPALIPADRLHLDTADRELLLRLDLLVAQGRHEAAQEVAEQLWAEATDAHRSLYQALSNALTSVCARERGQCRGAREIASRTRTMLEPYPATVIGIELPALLASVERFWSRGSGQIVLISQGPAGDDLPSHPSRPSAAPEGRRAGAAAIRPGP